MYDLFAEALCLGMDYDTFFLKDPLLFKPYYEAHKKQVKILGYEMELQSWLTGGYTAHSIGSTLGKGKYPDPPRLKEETVEKVKEITDGQDTQVLKHYNSFLQWSKLFNKSMTKGEENQ